MFFKIEKNENSNSIISEDISNNNNINNNISYLNTDIYDEKGKDLNYNKSKSQIIDNNHFFSLKTKKSKDSNSNLKNKIHNDFNISPSINTMTSSDILENNINNYQQNNNWINYNNNIINDNQNQFLKSNINNDIINNNNYYPKKKNNYNQNRHKKGKIKKNYKNYNNYKNMNNLKMNEFMLNMPNNTISYDDTNKFPYNNHFTQNSDFNNINSNNQINNGIIQNNNIILGQNNNYYNRIPQRNKQFFNNQIIRNQNGINNYNNYNFMNQNQNYNLINNNSMINNYISQRPNNYDIDNVYINKPNISSSFIETNIKKTNNKFNINNSFDNIANFYNNTNFNRNNSFNINNNFNLDFYNHNNQNNQNNHNINYINNNIYKKIDNDIIIKNNIIKNNNKEKKNIFRNINIKIKIGEKELEKEIIYNMEKDNKENIVNNIIKDYNLDQTYFEPILNIIENTIDILNNFDKIKISKYGIKKIEESKEYNLFFKENKNNGFNKLIENNINNSFILDLIENNIYKDFSADIRPEIDIIEKKQNRNYSFDYKKVK